jgi:phage-related protein
LTVWHICHIIKGEKYMYEFQAEFYEKESGEVPVEDFLLALDVKMRAKLAGMIQILQEKGNMLREPYSKHIDDEIFELRAKVGSDISRVLYFFYYDGKIILTNGFVKKTQKTPRAEIERAKRFRTDYLERCENNEKIR